MTRSSQLFNSREMDQEENKTPTTQIIILLVIVLLIAIYPLVRFGGLWNGTGDTGRMAQAIKPIYETGTLVPQGEYIYSNGYAFQALSIFILRVTGISLTAYQLFLGVFLVLWMVVPLWLLFRELIKSPLGATLATTLIILNSDILFVTLRGTHEKFTRGLIVLAIFILIKSIRDRSDMARHIGYILSFYLMSFAIAAFNNFFGSTFLFAITVALLGYLVVNLWKRNAEADLRPSIKKMSYAVVVSFAIVFIYIFYLYKPAISTLLVLDSFRDQVVALFLNFEESDTSGSYGYISAVWRSPIIFAALSAPTIILLLSSFLIWISQSISLFRNRDNNKDLNLMLWAFYGAFGLLGLVSIAVDVSKSYIGNTQNRAMTYILMFAAALLVSWILKREFQLSRWKKVLVGSALAILAVLSLLKFSNEPTLTSQWTFYSPSELVAIDWARAESEGNPGSFRVGPLWVSADERVDNAYQNVRGRRAAVLDANVLEYHTRDVMISDIVSERMSILEREPPILFDDFVTYDNGRAQIYHFRPRTAYQK